jgi:hypothetical protein
MTQAFEEVPARDILKAARQDRGRKLVRRFLPKVCTVLIAIAFLNLLLFLAGTLYLGGDAWNGKIEGRHHYLWGYHNGTKGYKEVSRAAFEYSRWHVYSVMVTWPLAIVACVVSARVARED